MAAAKATRALWPTQFTPRRCLWKWTLVSSGAAWPLQIDYSNNEAGPADVPALQLLKWEVEDKKAFVHWKA